MPVEIGKAEPYAWPGGYPIGYATGDGEYLCADCVNDPTNPVVLNVGARTSSSCVDAQWRIDGIEILEGSAEDYDGSVSCAHCGKVLVEEEVTAT